MTDEQILDLWGQASKNVGLKNPRHFDELREFAQLLTSTEREKCAKDAEWCIQNHLEHLMPERIRARSNT